MRHMKRWIPFLPLAVLLASSGAFAIKVQTGTDDLNLNLNVLLQARAEGDFDGPPGAAAPSGNFNTDFFLRRAQLRAWGSAYKYFTFEIKLDTPFFGRRGNYGGSTFIQDLFVGFVPLKDVNIEAGFLYMPFSHYSLSAAPATSVLDSPSAILFYNNARGLRENGVQIRALLFDHRILVRGGVYEGARSSQSLPAAPSPRPPGFVSPPPVNPNGRPLVAGILRVNLIGDEPGSTYPGIYLDGKSRASVGVGAQYQSHGAVLPNYTDARGNLLSNDGLPPGTTSYPNYLALAADAFVDYAFPGDREAVVQVAGYRFDYGSGNAKTGVGAAGDVGFRFGQIEPEANFYWFNSDTKQNSYLKVAGGLNFFLRGHQAKITAEFASVIDNGILTDAPGRPATPALHQIVVQGQAAF